MVWIILYGGGLPGPSDSSSTGLSERHTEMSGQRMLEQTQPYVSTSPSISHTYMATSQILEGLVNQRDLSRVTGFNKCHALGPHRGHRERCRSGGQ